MSGNGVLTFDVPLPPVELSPNYKTGYRPALMGARAGYRDRVRDEAIIAARLADWEMPQRVRVSLVFGTKADKRSRLADRGYRPRDTPNAVSAWKQGFDGLVLAGIVPDDNHEHLELGNVTVRPDLGPGVTVIVVALE